MIDTWNPAQINDAIQNGSIGSGGGGPDIPTPEAADNGKFLGVVEGNYSLQNIPGIPTPEATDNGKFLGVANGAYSLQNIPETYTPVDYSTQEQNTGLKWIDGSDIYQITKNINVQNDGDSVIEANFGENKNVIDIRGIANVIYNNVTHQFPIPGYPNDSNPLRFILYIAGNDLHVNSLTGNTANVTFYYTKTNTNRRKKS